MRANGREGFRGKATEGVWFLPGNFTGSGGGAREPVFKGSRLLQKTVMEATRIPQRRRGESSDPMVMKATMAIPALMTSDRFHNAT